MNDNDREANIMLRQAYNMLLWSVVVPIWCVIAVIVIAIAFGGA